MAYDPTLADRIREILGSRKALLERSRYGGLVFLLDGRACCGVVKDALIVRVRPDELPEALAQPFARAFEAAGKPVKGMVYVTPGGLQTHGALKTWVDRGLRFARTPPAGKR
jgi:hypothetical protein